MSREEKIVQEISAWKTKHSVERIDTKALDNAVQALAASNQQIGKLQDQLKAAKQSHQNMVKALGDSFSAIKANRKELRKSQEKAGAASKTAAKAKVADASVKAQATGKAKTRKS